MFIVVDVGGTNTRVAASKDGETIADKKRFSTLKAFEEGISQISDTIKSLAGKDTVEGVAVGIPGTIDHRTGKTIIVPNIPTWNDQNVGEVLESSLHIPVTCANDAELAALGEAVFGAGKDHRVAGYLTVSTGIGGSLVIDKKLVPRSHNTEPGGMIIDMNSEMIDSLGRKGTFETLASGLAFTKRFGLRADECTDPEIWRMHIQVLGQGVVNVILMWSPEILVIGGGLTQGGDFLFKPLRKFVKDNLRLFPPPPIVPAELGDDVGLFGGLALLSASAKHEA